MKLKPLNKNLIQDWINKFDNDPEVAAVEKAIERIVELYPNNNDLEQVHVKVQIINALYKTRVIATRKMAKQISRSQIDHFLVGNRFSEDEAIGLVEKIAKLKLNERVRHFYSFAAKYCNWHNQAAFPIYDKIVRKVLTEYKKKDKLLKFKQSDLDELWKLGKFYSKFKEIIDQMVDKYGLRKENLSYKAIDKFLWFYGRKELFPIKDKLSDP